MCVNVLPCGEMRCSFQPAVGSHAHSEGAGAGMAAMSQGITCPGGVLYVAMPSHRVVQQELLVRPLGCRCRCIEATAPAAQPQGIAAICHGMRGTRRVRD